MMLDTTIQDSSTATNVVVVELELAPAVADLDRCLKNFIPMSRASARLVNSTSYALGHPGFNPRACSIFMHSTCKWEISPRFNKNKNWHRFSMLQCSSFATELSMPDVGASTGEMKHFLTTKHR
jgi:hypothetical protein